RIPRGRPRGRGGAVRGAAPPRSPRGDTAARSGGGGGTRAGTEDQGPAPAGAGRGRAPAGEARVFTGLIEGMGHVRAVAPAEGLTRLALATPFPAAEVALGESVAVDGVCLTATARTAEGIAVDAVAETLQRTTLGGLRPGDPVNLERALRLGDRLGGHLVQGHVDGTAAVLEVVRRGGDVRLAMELPEGLRPFVAFKGS